MNGNLPDGWVRDVDGYGKPYYWHVASGITQREHPLSTSLQGDEDFATAFNDNNDESAEDMTQQIPAIQRFFVTSLGWRPLTQSDLAADQVSRSIQRCIENLSCDKSAANITDSVASWGGDGKKICLEIDCERGELLIRDAMSVQSLLFDDAPVGKALTTQSLQSVRAWGIGTDGNRDFAYVVRDPMSSTGSPVFQCHVLRCDDGDASRIASAIYEGCNMAGNANNRIESITENTDENEECEQDQVSQGDDGTVPQKFDVSALSFALPHPVDEPRKIILCHFVGSAEADGPVGMKVMNDAIARALQRHPVERWHFAAVMISPSAVIVRDASEAHHSVDNKDRPLLDCRVRYLSFVGIASDDVRVCAFITHAADDSFFAHVFHCEPSAGALSKAIEAACELRFQKCLDSRQSAGGLKSANSVPNSNSESMLSAYSSKVSNFANSVAKRFAGFNFGGLRSNAQPQPQQPVVQVKNRANNTRRLVLPAALTNFAQKVSGGWQQNNGIGGKPTVEVDSLLSQ